MQDLYIKFCEGELGKIGLSGNHRCADRSTTICASVDFSSSTHGYFSERLLLDSFLCTGR